MSRPRTHYFDPEGYVLLYPDVARSGMDPQRHYLRFGHAEGRQPGLLTAPLRARDLLMGMLTGGIGALEEMALTHPRRAERVWATHMAADVYAGKGDWAAAHALLRPLDIDSDIVGAFGQHHPTVLVIEAALDQGDMAHAAAVLKAGFATFGRLPDLVLAQANIVGAVKHGGDARAWHGALRPLFTRKALIAPTLNSNERNLTPFDMLSGRSLIRRGRMLGPLVSVIMPARNAAATIETALRSLLAQSWQRLEILVVDNGSTDATSEIVRRMAHSDPRIRLIDGGAEPGAYAARNLGLAQASGAVITLLDADDWAHPARITRQLRALRRHPASLSHWARMRPDLRITRWWRGQGLIHPNNSSLMLRREVVTALGFWDRVRAGGDSEYIDRVRSQYGVDAVALVHPDVPLSFGRQTGGSLTGDTSTDIATMHSGARRTYMEAAARWHSRMAADLPLPQYPLHRVFDVPAALAQGDETAVAVPQEQLIQEGAFDPEWYLRSYTDVRGTGVDPLCHYLHTGASEGRDPRADFSTSGYAHAHGIAREQALLSWQAAGAKPLTEQLPMFEGALVDGVDAQRILFFGHQCREAVFGAERSLLDMLDRSIEAGCLPSVVLPEMMNEGYLNVLLKRTHKVYIRPYSWLYGGVLPPEQTVKILASVIADSGATAVHVNTSVLEAPSLAARAQGVRVTLHLRELPQSDPQLCLGLGFHAADLRTHLLTLGDRFVANSQAVADWLMAPADKVRIVHNTVDPALFDLPFAPPVRPRVALIGSLTERKGVADFITLARLAHKAGLLADFVTIGSESADLGALGQMPITLRHAGYVESPLEAMMQADVVVSLSKVAESFGRTVLEAMAAGRPVICYDRGTPPELVGRDGRAGAVVQPDDPQSVLAALMGLLDSDALEQAGIAARARAREIQRSAIAAGQGVYAAD